jgi:hypothetical protein
MNERIFGMARVAVAALSIAGAAGSAWAQAGGNASAAKKELVARVLKLQQPAVEAMGRMLAEQPAQQAMLQVQGALQRVPADKRDALAKEIEGDLRAYVDQAVPVVRNRAVALAPATIGPLLEQRFSEDELKQIITMLESPVNAKYQAMAGEIQRALGEKLVAETKGAVEPQVQKMRESIAGRINAALPKTN